MQIFSWSQILSFDEFLLTLALNFLVHFLLLKYFIILILLVTGFLIWSIIFNVHFILIDSHFSFLGLVYFLIFFFNVFLAFLRFGFVERLDTMLLILSFIFSHIFLNLNFTVLKSLIKIRIYNFLLSIIFKFRKLIT